MMVPASFSHASIFISILYSIPIFTSGAYAQSASSNSSPSTRLVEVDIENHGTVELTISTFKGTLEWVNLPSIDVTNAVVRSDGPTTCFFHKWPIEGFPDDDGLFVSTPIRTDSATAEMFEEFEAAQRVICYDSSGEWGRTTTTLLFQQDRYFSLNQVEPKGPGEGKWLNYPNNVFSTGGKRLDAVALLYPARRDAYCRLFNTIEDYPINDRKTYRDYGTVYFESPRMMNPDVRVRRIECN